jgi:predicted RNA-binding protein YlxR (DUF448 family)
MPPHPRRERGVDLAEALLSPSGSETGAPPPALTERPEDDGPLRRCIATGLSQAKETLIRFVLDPAGEVVPDLDEKLPGRGFYVSATRTALESAVKKKSFARAARQPVRVPEDLPDRLEALLSSRCRQLLGLARRAGQAVAGYDRVEDWLARGQVALLLQAADGAEGGRAKLAAKARGLPEIAVLTALELAEPFGRDHIIHVAVAAGGLARRLQTDLARLKALRAAPTVEKVREA